MIQIDHGIPTRRQRRPWTAEDDKNLRKFWAEKKSDVDIAYIMDRGRGLIMEHRQKLGLAANCMGGGPRGRDVGPETRAKLSKISRQRWADDAYKARLLAKLRTNWRAWAERQYKPPPRGTPEYRRYKKLVDILGPEQAHVEFQR